MSGDGGVTCSREEKEKALHHYINRMGNRPGISTQRHATKICARSSYFYVTRMCALLCAQGLYGVYRGLFLKCLCACR